MRSVFVLVLCILGAGELQAQTAAPRDTIYVADRFLRAPVQGARIVAKFGNAATRAETIRLDAVVTKVDKKDWLLGDILVNADFDGNGFIAVWTVAGPKEVIDAHINAIRALSKDRSKIYDHGIIPVVVKCACD